MAKEPFCVFDFPFQSLSGEAKEGGENSTGTPRGLPRLLRGERWGSSASLWPSCCHTSLLTLAGTCCPRAPGIQTFLYREA